MQCSADVTYSIVWSPVCDLPLLSLTLIETHFHCTFSLFRFVWFCKLDMNKLGMVARVLLLEQEKTPVIGEESDFEDSLHRTISVENGPAVAEVCMSNIASLMH